MSKKKIGLIVFLIVAITLLHYITSPVNALLHEFYRELYFVPVILAGLWGGKRIGLITSIAITIFFLPHVIRSMGTTFGTLLINLFEIGLFNMAGLFAGLYRDTKRGYITAMSTPYHPAEIKKDILLFIDGTPTSLYAANYLAGTFGRIPDMGVTLLWVLAAGQEADFFESPEEASSYSREQYQKTEEILKHTKEILLKGGISENNIRVQRLSVDKKTRISDKLLEEARNGHFDTIVIGKHPKTRSQEFLFGSTAVALVRDTLVNIITVKAPEEGGRETYKTS